MTNIDKLREVLGKGMGGHEKPGKGANDVWLTPLSIVHALGRFDLDPCGEAHHKTAKLIYTENGLDKPWFGRVWLNPPYSQVGDWLERLAEYQWGIALVFARTDTKWAQKFIPRAASVFFPEKRIRFLHKDLTPAKYTAGAPSMFLSFGEYTEWDKVGNGIVFRNSHEFKTELGGEDE